MSGKGCNNEYLKVPDEVYGEGCELSKLHHTFIQVVARDLNRIGGKVSGINKKFWAILLILISQMAALIGYFISR